MRRRSARAGVTLIEMLVVVTIISVFLLVVGPRLLGQGDKARQTAARQQIQSFEQMLASYKLDTGTFPSNEMGLKALREKPQNVNNWNGPYSAKEIPVDPWGNAYIYKYPGSMGMSQTLFVWGRMGSRGASQ